LIAVASVADTGYAAPRGSCASRYSNPFTIKGKLGSGLGRLLHGIITRHQGEIIVVSEPGEGTRFEVRLLIVRRATDS
jgi:signal transduction histidine kinase